MVPLAAGSRCPLLGASDTDNQPSLLAMCKFFPWLKLGPSSDVLVVGVGCGRSDVGGAA